MRSVKQELKHLSPVKDDEEAGEEIPVAWNAEQANAWRAKNPAVSLWRIVQMQAGLGAILVLLVWLVAKNEAIVWSVAYGVMSVLMPAAMFARGVQRVITGRNLGQGVMRFMVWELAKIALTIAMLCLAPMLVSSLNWLALLAGFVVTMKVYWVAVWLRPVQNKSILLN